MVDHGGTAPHSGVGGKNEAGEENKLKTKEFYRAGLLFYDNGNLKKAIDQWDLALTYDKGNSLVINKLAKALEELDYLISEHYKNGKMHLKYSRFNQAENDFTIVVELAREKRDTRYLDALEQLEWIRKQ
jgi:tetratricopeptide (TPR) repeat protein